MNKTHNLFKSVLCLVGIAELKKNRIYPPMMSLWDIDYLGYKLLKK